MPRALWRRADEIDEVRDISLVMRTRRDAHEREVRCPWATVPVCDFGSRRFEPRELRSPEKRALSEPSFGERTFAECGEYGTPDDRHADEVRADWKCGGAVQVRVQRCDRLLAQ